MRKKGKNPFIGTDFNDKREKGNEGSSLHFLSSLHGLIAAYVARKWRYSFLSVDSHLSVQLSLLYFLLAFSCNGCVKTGAIFFADWSFELWTANCISLSFLVHSHFCRGAIFLQDQACWESRQQSLEPLMISLQTTFLPVDQGFYQHLDETRALFRILCWQKRRLDDCETCCDGTLKSHPHPNRR